MLKWVSEHRGLFGSLAVTLIGIGLAGYVSLRVSGAVAGHPVKLGPTTQVCLTIFDVGAVIFIWVCMSLFHQWRIKRKISKFTVKGILLAGAISSVPNDDQQAFEDLHSQFATWVSEVLEWLDKHDSGAAIHFGNDAGRLVTEGLMGSGGIAGLRANIDTRMARLGEMAEKRL